MVRIFIRNGACGVEEFFKLVSSENKVAVLLTCYEKEAATFQELGEALRESMDSSALAKRLSEFVAAGLLEKLVYSRFLYSVPYYPEGRGHVSLFGDDAYLLPGVAACGE